MRRSVRPGECPTEVIVRAVADKTGRCPEDLRPFADSIDTDAVDDLFMRSSGNGPQELTLLYEGCQVTVEEDMVRVDEVPGTARSVRSSVDE